MSAGGLSYSAITNFGKITLPSVDTWGSNMNILKDPPKSITTRRIDKVGQTSSITEMVDESGNRAAEVILPFARGINPSVSVSYNNYGNNGGQGSRGVFQNQTQAFLPYRVDRDGAFRPPVVNLEQLYPLSRLPRVWTTAFTQPGFADFSKKMRVCGTAKETKEVKNDLLKTSARPTAVYKIETPLEKPMETKYSIQDTINVSGNSGIRSMDRTTQNVLKPTKEVNYDNLHSFAHSNMSDIKHVNNYNMHTEKFIQDTNSHSVYSNLGSEKMQITPLSDMSDLSNIRTNDLHNINYITQTSGTDQSKYIHDDIKLDRVLPEYNTRTNFTGNKKVTYIHDDIELNRVLPQYNTSTNFSGNEKVSYIHDNIELDRVLPEYNASTNMSQNTHKVLRHDYMKELDRNTPLTNMTINKGGNGENNISSRNINLLHKINAGGYDIPAQIPQQNRLNLQHNLNPTKSQMSKVMSQEFEGRYAY